MVMPEPTKDTVFGDLNQLIGRLSGLDERGLVLSLAAFAEDSLGTLLKSFMLPVSASSKLVDDFNAPLGTFSSRILACYSLGLLTKGQFEDLERLRKIRNAFSHTWQAISFEDQAIATHIQCLNYSNADDERPPTPIDKLRSSISFLLVELQITATNVRNGKQARVIGTRLLTGLTGTVDDQLQHCRRSLERIDSELLAATGEERRFLDFQRERWEGNLLLVLRTSPREDSARIQAVIDEVNVRKTWSYV